MRMYRVTFYTVNKDYNPDRDKAHEEFNQVGRVDISDYNTSDKFPMVTKAFRAIQHQECMAATRVTIERI